MCSATDKPAPLTMHPPDPGARFNGLPVLTEYIDGRTWRLHADVSYLVSEGRLKGERSTARTGFIFDWATTPRITWGFLPPSGLTHQPYGIAALFHDWLYIHHAIAGIAITRREADAVFLEIMLYVGVAAWRARMMWLAVRLGGWWGWSRFHRQGDPTCVCAPACAVSSVAADAGAPEGASPVQALCAILAAAVIVSGCRTSRPGSGAPSPWPPMPWGSTYPTNELREVHP